MAHTNRQHRFSESVNAHNASVTSYTTANSSGAVVAGADIFRRNSKASSASSRLTRQSSASDVKASSVAALVLLARVGFLGAPCAVPLGSLGGECTGIGAIACWLLGLTLADVPPTECFEESSVETLSGKWWCGRRGMFW